MQIHVEQCKIHDACSKHTLCGLHAHSFAFEYDVAWISLRSLQRHLVSNESCLFYLPVLDAMFRCVCRWNI